MQPVGSTDDLPQIPEPDGSYMLNQKFVIPIYKKSAGICTCYSSHVLRLLHAHRSLNEQRRSPRRYV